MGNFLLVDAAKQGDLEQVRTLLNEGRDVNEEDEAGYTPLIWAAENGHFEIASLLVENGAAINHQSKFGWNAVYIASFKNHISIVSLLIEKGADFNIKTKNGDTPLMRSAYYGYFSIVSLLLQNGADASLLDNDGKTALYLARQENKSDCVTLLENYEHFHRYRKVWLSFLSSLRSYQKDHSKQIQNQSQSQVHSPSLNRVMDSSDLVRYVTEFM